MLDLRRQDIVGKVIEWCHASALRAKAKAGKLAKQVYDVLYFSFCWFFFPSETLMGGFLAGAAFEALPGHLSYTRLPHVFSKACVARQGVGKEPARGPCQQRLAILWPLEEVVDARKQQKKAPKPCQRLGPPWEEQASLCGPSLAWESTFLARAVSKHDCQKSSGGTAHSVPGSHLQSQHASYIPVCVNYISLPNKIMLKCHQAHMARLTVQADPTITQVCLIDQLLNESGSNLGGITACARTGHAPSIRQE